MSAESYRNWLEPVAYSHVGEDGCLHLVAPNSNVQSWLEAEFVPRIVSTARTLGLEIVSVAIGIAEPVPPMGQQSFDFELSDQPFNAKYTFDRFVVGSCNEFAHAASLAVAARPAEAYNPLYMYAGVGMGKTHLLHAIGHRLRSTNPIQKIVYVAAEEFMNEMIKSIRCNTMANFRERFRMADALLVDDIQVIGSKERTQEEFFHTFNTLHNNGKQIVISSDSDPAAIPGLVGRLKSRFGWGLMADIQPPDLETKMAILDRKAEEAGVTLDDEVRSLIAAHLNSNIRELEGALNRLVARARFVHSRITMGMVRHMFGSTAPQTSGAPSIPSILRVVASEFQLQVSDLTARNNARSVAGPRQISMYLCKQLTPASVSEIGRAFGKHHTTVLYAIQKIEREIEQNSTQKSIVNNLLKKLEFSVNSRYV